MPVSGAFTLPARQVPTRPRAHSPSAAMGSESGAQKQKSPHASRYAEWSQVRKQKGKPTGNRPRGAKAITHGGHLPAAGSAQAVSEQWLLGKGRSLSPPPRYCSAGRSVVRSISLGTHFGPAILAVSPLPAPCPLPGRQKEKRRGPGCCAGTAQQQLKPSCAANTGSDTHLQHGTRQPARSNNWLHPNQGQHTGPGLHGVPGWPTAAGREGQGPKQRRKRRTVLGGNDGRIGRKRESREEEAEAAGRAVGSLTGLRGAQPC